MIRFRKSQKIFFLGTATSLAFAGSSLVGLKQGKESNRLMAEQNAEMERANREQQKIEAQRLEQERKWQEQQLKLQKKALKQGVNPFGDSSILNNVTGTPTQPLQPPPTIYQNNYSEEQKNYSVFSFAKDMGILVSRNRGRLIGSVLSGVATSTGIYSADRAIRKHKESRERSAEDGEESSQREYSNKRIPIGGTIFSFAMGASLPAISYAIERKVGKDMTSSTKRRYYFREEDDKDLREKNYSVPVKAASKLLSGLSTLAGGGGAKGVRNLGIQISAIGRKSGNKATKKLGEAILKHPNASLIASIPGGLAVMGGTFAIGEKITTSVLKKKDKNAFGYVESKEKGIN